MNIKAVDMNDKGMDGASKTDELLENFQKVGRGVIRKSILQILDLLNMAFLV